MVERKMIMVSRVSQNRVTFCIVSISRHATPNLNHNQQGRTETRFDSKCIFIRLTLHYALFSHLKKCECWPSTRVPSCKVIVILACWVLFHLHMMINCFSWYILWEPMSTTVGYTFTFISDLTIPPPQVVYKCHIFINVSRNAFIK